MSHDFKLKIAGGTGYVAAPKASLLHISHSKGIILFPHNEKGKYSGYKTNCILNILSVVLGSLGFAPIHELAQKKSLKEEILAFPGDESLITAICLDPTEKFAFVAKGSNKLYAVDLAVGDKRPFISKIVQLDTAVVEVSSTKISVFGFYLKAGNF